MVKPTVPPTVPPVVSTQAPEADANTPRGRLQMADIARMAGVSTATVSRALAGSALVNENTRTRIEALAKSLNYTINVGAQNLRLGASKTIAVVLPYDAAAKQAVYDPFFLSMLGSLTNALTDAGYDVLLSRVEASRLDSIGNLFHSGRALGIIVIGQWHAHAQLNSLAASGVPMVVWGARMTEQVYSSVGSDNLTGGFAATEHLLSLGRKRIAFIGDAELPEVTQRYHGYLEAHRARGLEADPALTLKVPFLPDPTRVAVARLVASRVPFDGIFAASDLLAMTAISTLSSEGLTVPQQVSVVGYDDIDIAQHFHPALTTVRQPVTEAGRVMLGELLQLVAGKQTEPIQLATQLVVRASTVER
jgi:DNA-binding LacI/PurR family transcriptional regulator